MTPTYTIPCQDGTDPNCDGTVDVQIPKEDLTPEEAIHLAQHGHVDIDGEDRFEFHVKGTICDPCGSDAERPKDAAN